jgi:hypothetical protein
MNDRANFLLIADADSVAGTLLDADLLQFNEVVAALINAHKRIAALEVVVESLLMTGDE